MVQSMRLIAQQEGATALWKGLSPALVRQISYTGLSMVLYTPIRDLIAGPGTRAEDIPFYQRFVSAGAAGGVSIIIANPTDLIKTQMQNSASRPSMARLARNVWQQDGIMGFWRGVGPNAARCVLGMACELGCYDSFKTNLISSGVLADGPVAHFAASAGAGLVSAVVSTPVDVVKIRLMSQAGGQGGGKDMVRYKGALDAFSRIAQLEGVGALYKGFTLLAGRKIGWTVVYFMAFEKALHAVTGEYHT